MVHRIEEKIKGGMYDSVIFSEYFRGMRIVIADIETTGLSYKKDSVILTGFVYQDEACYGIENGKFDDRVIGESSEACLSDDKESNDSKEASDNMEINAVDNITNDKKINSTKFAYTMSNTKLASDGSSKTNAKKSAKNRYAVQFFADSIDDERELLGKTMEFLSDFDVIITFNGRTFDIPFLKKRAEFYGIETLPLDRMYSFDMLRVLKYHSHLPEILPNMKQKTIESYLGDADLRKDSISGAQSAELYFKYMNMPASMRAKRESIKQFILLHNRDDIFRLSEMMRILRILDLHEIMNAEGFALKIKQERFAIIRRIRIKSTAIFADGDFFGSDAGAAHYLTDYYELKKEKNSTEFAARISCERVAKALVADLCALDTDEEPLTLASEYESGYLILSEKDITNFRAINLLVAVMLRRLLGRL